MTKKKASEPDEAPVVQAALALQRALDRIERLGEQASFPISTRSQLTRAGEFLERAADGHRDFLGRLTELTQAVGALRDRQNAAAEAMSELAQRVDERRVALEALDQRMATIGKRAREIVEAMSAGEQPAAAEGADAARLTADLAAARAALTDVVGEARTLTDDAHELGFTDVERDAHAVRQQLEAMLQKLDRFRGPPN